MIVAMYDVIGWLENKCGDTPPCDLVASSSLAVWAHTNFVQFKGSELHCVVRMGL